MINFSEKVSFIWSVADLLRGRYSAGPRQMARQESDKVMNSDHLALYLKLSKSTLYKLAVQGKLPGQKVGKHWRFHKDTIDRWLDRKASATRE